MSQQPQTSPFLLRLHHDIRYHIYTLIAALPELHIGNLIGPSQNRIATLRPLQPLLDTCRATRAEIFDWASCYESWISCELARGIVCQTPTADNTLIAFQWRGKRRTSKEEMSEEESAYCEMASGRWRTFWGFEIKEPTVRHLCIDIDLHYKDAVAGIHLLFEAIRYCQLAASFPRNISSLMQGRHTIGALTGLQTLEIVLHQCDGEEQCPHHWLCYVNCLWSHYWDRFCKPQYPTGCPSKSRPQLKITTRSASGSVINREFGLPAPYEITNFHFWGYKDVPVYVLDLFPHPNRRVRNRSRRIEYFQHEPFFLSPPLSRPLSVGS